MARLVEFPLVDGGSVIAEVELGVEGGSGDHEVTRGWPDRDRHVVEQAQCSFEQAVGRVMPAVQELVHQLHSLTESPDAISVEFGLELSAEVGAIVAGASTRGNFKVSMTWRPSNSPGAARADQADAGV